jgi:hypothetical protein
MAEQQATDVVLTPEAQEVQDALSDPRVGDVFHEMYSFGVQVLHVGDVFHEMYSFGVQVLHVDETHVGWRSFSSTELGRGWETREKWAESFRYANIPASRTMMLQRRGDEATP